ncbi:shikimate dehydrogenase, partial [Vibrio parahaemolyticus VP2007-007]
LVVPLVV